MNVINRHLIDSIENMYRKLKKMREERPFRYRLSFQDGCSSPKWENFFLKEREERHSAMAKEKERKNAIWNFYMSCSVSVSNSLDGVININ